MPNATPLPPQATQAAQHPGMAQQYSFASGQFRPAGQDQQQHATMMMSQYPYGFHMNYGMPGPRSGYQWGVGRGMPNQVNGQGGVTVQQQMQMAVGKPTQGAGR